MTRQEAHNIITGRSALVYSTDGWESGPAYAEWHLMPDGRYRYSRRRKDTGDLRFGVAYQTRKPTGRFDTPARAEGRTP